ncbi:hypothetical protein ACFS2C_26960 [Prauserella oleivorans]|uniref:Uncharacterized protein n=1 Tax=Prauserella oleivorans TaxID=1478153 RepID=A0ABW5WIN0_9PSEU
MTWQEELRRLDAQLAAGAITHDEHRRRREDILAEVSGTPVVSPFAAPRKKTDDGGPRWQAANPAAAARLPETADPDSIQPTVPASVPPAPAQPAGQSPAPASPPAPSAPPELPQLPQPAQSPQRQQSPPSPTGPPAGPAQATQPVTTPPPPRFNPAVLLSAGTRTTAPSPADTELTMPLMRVQGPLVHQEPPENRGRTRTWLVLALAVFVALAAVIGGAWWLGQDDDPESVSAPSPSSAAPTEVALEDRLPTLPGQPNPNNSTMSVQRGVDLGLYTEAEGETMRRHGATELIYRSSAEGPALTDGYTLLVVRTSSHERAAQLADHMNTTTAANGFTSSLLPEDDRFVVLSRTDSAGRVSLVWYASGSTAVGIGVSQARDADPAALQERLQTTLTSVEEVLPRG